MKKEKELKCHHIHTVSQQKNSSFNMHLSERAKKSQLHGYKQVLVYTCETHNSCGLYFPPSDSASANLQLNKQEKYTFSCVYYVLYGYTAGET